MSRRPLGLVRADCAAVVLDGRVSVFCPDSGTVHTLSGSASSVWHMLDGTSSLDEVVDRLATAYGAPADVVRADVLDVVAELQRSALLTDVREQ